MLDFHQLHFIKHMSIRLNFLQHLKKIYVKNNQPDKNIKDWVNNFMQQNRC